MTDQISQGRWWHGLTGYQWFVFAITGLAWMFDTLDQRLFSLARISALSHLMDLAGSDTAVQAYAKTVTAMFLVGWGTGGIVIGALGDRYGRVRLLTWSIMIYSVGTGLTALSQTPDQFAVLRAITGFGIGGVFGLAVAIIAETFDGTTRVMLLAGLQLLATAGNICAALVKMGVDGLAASGVLPGDTVWRWLFAIGTLPILLAMASALKMKEPETWQHLRDSGQLPQGPLGSYAALFTNKDERRNLLIGSMLATSGVLGLWAIGEYAVDLQDAVFTSHFMANDPSGQIKSQVASAKNWAYLLQMAGGAVGMMLFSWVANSHGRRPAFLGGFSAALLLTLFAYWKLDTPADAYWMMPLMGAAQLSVFAGFSIYLPELFGARARGAGVSFCYNLGRFAAAGGSFASALLTTRLFAAYTPPLPLRYSAMTMCVVFLLGIGAALAAPETRGKPFRV